MKKKKFSNHEIVEQLKEMRRDRKIIKPGKWSVVETSLNVAAKLKKNKSIACSLGEFLGKYITHDNGYKDDGYQALVNIVIENQTKLIEKYGIDQVLAACEKSLNSYLNKNKKKILGDIVIMQLLDDRKDKSEKYLSCLIKTNRKQIPKFLGMSEGILKVFE